MKSSKIVLSILVLAVALTACQSVEFKKSSGGVPYKIFSSKKGDSVKVGSIVKYQVIQKIKDSVLYSSYNRKHPEYFQVRPSAEKGTYGNIKSTVEEVISKAKEGDSIYLAQSTDNGQPLTELHGTDFQVPSYPLTTSLPSAATAAAAMPRIGGAAA